MRQITRSWTLPRRSPGGSTRRSPSSRSCSKGRRDMGEVVVKVNGRDFALSCADGQEPRIRRLAQYVDGKIGEFAKNLGQIGEARLILLAALVIADELSDANEAVQQAQNRARAVAGPGSGLGGEATERAASGIRGIAERIESIA